MSTRPYPPELKAAVLAEYEAGATCEQIADARGLSASTVHKWVQVAGISRPRTGRSNPRGCVVEGCDMKHRAKGYCGLHYGRFVLGHGPRDVNHADRLEDCRWMAECGESLTGAARRIGISRNGLDTWLRKYDPDTLRVLTAREAWPEESKATFHGATSRVSA